MFGFVDQEIARAAGDGRVGVVQQYLDRNPHQLENRTIFQSNLLHIAARNGQVAVVEELLKRGSNVDALDFGGMRRTALHWACQGGFVRIVELLIDHGADTKIWCSHDILLGQQQQQVEGKAWSKLVQGKRCGCLIDTEAAFEASPANICSNNLVKLALGRPAWTPETNCMYPEKFKEVVRQIMFAQHCKSNVKSAKAQEGRSIQMELAAPVSVSCWPLDWDSSREILAIAAYPISTWL